ncbi:MAG: hypothetical protein HOU81_01595 [Hamadaea sp.]|uniref:lipocalin-like domain-containing protein n=1 Tax=Hamadaea sp. TaxID=2024425 RepID=UPI0017AA2AE3|nr:lipocalin-like domain-containing protein [Hamadaea sp.]NUR69493.1 hypothetical protein [Hamadaea sp.]NUT20729.1 hypothetical protein [Hamadaea sp.]
MRSHRSKAAVVAVALSALAVTAATATMPATAQSSRLATTAAPATTALSATSAPAFPTFAQLPADQAAHPDAPQEWWYVVGHLNAHGHEFGYEVQIVAGATPRTLIAITDKTTGQYYTQSQVYPVDQTSFSATELDVRVPSATLSGPTDAMRLHATLPAGTVDLTLSAAGPAMYNNGTGLMPFLGGTSYYYSLPRLVSRGTVTVGGTAYQVTGQSWLDRQWGTWDWTTNDKWTWMALQLSNGDTINFWDILDRTGEHSYATVLRPNGTHEIVAVTPLAGGTGDWWTSPTTGKRYGTRWTVTIPGLDTALTVVAIPGQEIQSFGGIFEGAAGVTGRYHGKQISGQAYVEQLGNWS